MFTLAAVSGVNRTAYLLSTFKFVFILITIQVHVIQPSRFKDSMVVYDIIFCRFAGISIYEIEDANQSIFLVPVTWFRALGCSWTASLLGHDNLINGKYSSCSLCSDANSKFFGCKHVINTIFSDILYAFI